MYQTPAVCQAMLDMEDTQQCTGKGRDSCYWEIPLQMEKGKEEAETAAKLCGGRWLCREFTKGAGGLEDREAVLFRSGRKKL